MSGKHTPGPWKLIPDPKRGVGITSEVRPARSIAYVQFAGTDLEDGLANAQLMVTAPEMLGKLKEIHGGMACICKLQGFVGGQVPCDTCQIGALIAKAEGRAA